MKNVQSLRLGSGHRICFLASLGSSFLLTCYFTPFSFSVGLQNRRYLHKRLWISNRLTTDDLIDITEVQKRRLESLFELSRQEFDNIYLGKKLSALYCGRFRNLSVQFQVSERMLWQTIFPLRVISLPSVWPMWTSLFCCFLHLINLRSTTLLSC